MVYEGNLNTKEGKGGSNRINERKEKHIFIHKANSQKSGWKSSSLIVWKCTLKGNWHRSITLQKKMNSLANTQQLNNFQTKWFNNFSLTSSEINFWLSQQLSLPESKTNAMHQFVNEWKRMKCIYIDLNVIKNINGYVNEWE